MQRKITGLGTELGVGALSVSPRSPGHMRGPRGLPPARPPPRRTGLRGLTAQGCLVGLWPGWQPHPLYLLQLGVPGELLSSQGEARAQLQPASPDPVPEQHLPVSGHTQQLEAVAVPGLQEPDHLGDRERSQVTRGHLLRLLARPAVSLHMTFPFSSRREKKKRETS